MPIPFEDRGSTSRLFDATAGLPKPRWQARRELHTKLQLAHEKSPAQLKAPPRRPTVDDYVGLCLLIDFPDLPLAVTPGEVSAFCNDSGYAGFGNQGSVFDYFHDVSAGRLRYRTIVAPRYTAKHGRSHYTKPEIPYGERARELIEEALRFHIDAGFDFSPLSVDAQKGVYAVNVIYAGDAGPREGWGKGIWPHASRLLAPLHLAAGRSAMDYQIGALGDGLSLGVYCHENGHMLCDFPDLYFYKKQEVSVGRYCLMSLGINPDPRNPTQVCGYLKYRAGWGQADRLKSGQHWLGPSQPNRFLIHPHGDSTTEYVLIEYRANTGRDAMLPGAGLAIWQVHEHGSNTRPEEQPEGRQFPECVLLQADGLGELDEGGDDGDAGDLFGPAPAGVVLPGGWRDGRPFGLRIEAIKEEGDGLRLAVAVG